MPGTSVRMMEKAPSLGADMVMLDLEDAVAPDDKPQARENVIAALRELDWSGCSVSLRINGLDTHYCYRDIVDVVEQSGRWLDTVLVPKASCAGDIHLVATLLTQIEDALGLEQPDRHLRADRDGAGHAQRRRDRRRLPGADGGADLRRRRLRRLDAEPHRVDRRLRPPATRCSPTPRRRGRASCTGATSGITRWRASRSPAARNGLRPIDGPFGDFDDPDGYLAAARRAAVLGFEGKWAIHPSQVELANEVFSPDDSLIDADPPDHRGHEGGRADGQGRGLARGPLIDAASLRMAEHLLAKIELIEERALARGPRAVGSSEAWPARSSSAS